MNKSVFAAVIWLWLAVSSISVAQAQLSPDSLVGLSAGLTKLFGTVTAFSAQGELQVVDTNRQEALRIPMGFTLLDGKLRMDFDMNQAKGKSVSPSMIAALKQAGMDKVSSIVRLDTRTAFMTFPNARTFQDLQVSSTDAAAADKNVQVQRAVITKEAIDQRPCTKTRVLVKNSKGIPLLDAITWNAADMKEFPIQIAVASREGTTLLRFKKVQLTRPAATQFELPAGYSRFGALSVKVQTSPARTAAPTNTSPAQISAPGSKTLKQPAPTPTKRTGTTNKPAATPVRKK